MRVFSRCKLLVISILVFSVLSACMFANADRLQVDTHKNSVLKMLNQYKQLDKWVAAKKAECRAKNIPKNQCYFGQQQGCGFCFNWGSDISLLDANANSAGGCRPCVR